MNEITATGLDLAKPAITVHGVDATRRTALRKTRAAGKADGRAAGVFDRNAGTK